MLARLQQFVVLVLVAACAAWVFWWVRNGQVLWAVAGAFGIAFGHAGVLGAEFLFLGLRAGAPTGAPRPTARQLAAAWGAEVVAATRVFYWRQPFRSRSEPDHFPLPPRALRGVVLVHGFACNRGFWNPWMRRLRQQGIPFVAVDLEPVFGSVDNYAQATDSAVRRLEAHTGLAPVIVGHSMGGLAIRAWLRATGDDARAHRVITIGSPHHGTWLARFALTRNGRQMRPGSDWLRALAATETPDRYSRFTCFYGHCDNVVVPAAAATLAGADNRHVAGTAHVQLAFQQVVFDEVERWLGPSAADPAASRCISRRGPKAGAHRRPVRRPSRPARRPE